MTLSMVQLAEKQILYAKAHPTSPAPAPVIVLETAQIILEIVLETAQIVSETVQIVLENGPNRFGNSPNRGGNGQDRLGNGSVGALGSSFWVLGLLDPPGAFSGAPFSRLKSPKWPQHGSPNGAKMGQDGPRWAKMVPRWSQDEPRWPKMGPTWRPERPKMLPDGPRWRQLGTRMVPKMAIVLETLKSRKSMRVLHFY